MEKPAALPAGTRVERDSLGEMTVPADALYGASTARAVVNFPISGMRAHPKLLWALVAVKKAAAMVNRELGQFRDLQSRRPGAFRGRDPDEVAEAIVRAANDVMVDLAGDGARYGRQFVVDVFQAGAGTSLNMNVNEVIANHAIEILRGERGDRELVDPNDHVNMGQSTNDVIPTAMRVAALTLLKDLLTAVQGLSSAFSAKGTQFHHILKSGRTHLQDAVPMRLGDQFAAWAVTIHKNCERLTAAWRELEELGIGGNAVGTGINTPPEFAKQMAGVLDAETGRLGLRPGTNLIELCESTGAFASLSAALRSLALDLNRIANDLRLLASGPNTGLAEIELPAVQPGSSIMPGKVNPVMAEMLNMVCYQVMGNDMAVAMASQAGQLELNVMMPIIAHNLNESLTILASAIKVFTERCVAGIAADEKRCRHYLERSVGLATVLNPVIGYMEAARVVKKARAESKSIKEIVVAEGILTADEFDKLILQAVRD